MTNKSLANGLLHGKGVLITRQAHQASEFCTLIEQYGGKPYVFPVIETVVPVNTEQIERALARLETYQWIVFASSNAVAFFFHFLEKFNHNHEELAKAKIVAVGPSTAKMIEKFGFHVTAMPDHFTAEGIVEELQGSILKGDRFLLPKANIGREIIASSLEEAGCFAEQLVVYDTVPSNGKKIELIGLLSNKIDYITFTSSSTVENFIKVLGRESFDLLSNKRIITIGPKTSATAVEFGLHVDATAGTHSTEGMMDAIIEMEKLIGS